MTHLPIGIIDIGSNSVRLVVYDPPYIGQSPYFNEKVQCGLGRDLGTTGKLHPDGVTSSLKALTGFKALSDAMGLKDLHAVGTAALRDASDGPAFVEKVARDIGITIKVIDGEEEARLSALGVVQNFKNPKGVMGDLGGGSLELAVIKKDGIRDVLSLQLGVLRVLSTQDQKGYIKDELAKIPPSMLDQPNFYTVGGTWRALANIYYKDQGHPYERLMGKKIKAPAMIEFAEKIAGMSQSGLMETYKVEDRRAELMPMAALILKETLLRVNPKTMVVSTSGLRDGVLFEILKTL
jgi:exopolyphosphatase/guanosine-5'-triphosphate,3'-diphosphate pyrophosphatase